MPTFEFKAVNPSGQVVTEVLEATNEQAVSKEIYNRGFRPISIKSKKVTKAAESSGGGLFAKKVKIDEIVLFTKELVTLLKAGVPMLTALEALASQSGATMSVILNQIYVDVMSGRSFSQALDRHPKVFAKIFVNSVHAGELSGSLDEVLTRMAIVLKHDEETRKKVKGALKYPTFVITAMVIAFAVIMTQVMPKFVTMFESMKMELPLATKVLVAMSKFMQSYVLYIFGVTTVVGLAFFFLIKTPKGRYWWDGLIMKIPLTGPIIIKSAMARFTTMFETLNRSGLPILQTLNTVAGAVGNVVIEGIIKDVTLGVEKGQGIAGSMRQYKIFPPMVVRMISIGEQSGSLDDMLKSVAEHFDMEVEYAIEGLTSMIEPILTIGMAGAVLVLAMGIFMPMWSMVGMAG
ncbi:type II secretion system F family protein [candidate division KSB1 bacterium]|nr:type II secretion system F family protein [candidate division KSB1 bacterium]